MRKISMKGHLAETPPSHEEVQRYWEWYMERTQVPGQEHGSRGYFDAIRVDHDRAYSYPNQTLGLVGLRGKSLMELGCGIGLDTVEFARHGADVTAIDTSPTALDLAGRNLRHNGLQARLERENAEGLGYEAGTFDVVVARGILMFTPDDQKVVDEIHRVLKPGGEVQALLHKRVSWYHLLAKASGTNLVHPEKDPPINRLYSVRQARRLFSRFSALQIFMGRFPYETRRSGVFAHVFNRLVVPLTRKLPAALIRSFGYYIIVKAIR